MPEQFNYIPVNYNPFADAEIEQVGFTNEAQKEIYLSSLIGGDDANRAYNESFALDFQGTLNTDHLIAAVNDLVKRHEALRSTLSADGNYVFVSQFKPILINMIDLSGKSDLNKVEALSALAVENVERPFDLLNGPLQHFQLIKLTEGYYQFCITAHHIIADGWSVGVMLQDLGKLYSAKVSGKAAVLGPAPQMLQYAKEELAFATTKAHAEVQSYWHNQFKNTRPQFDLKTDFPRPAQRSYKSRRDDYPLEQSLKEAVQKMARQQSASFVTTLLTAFEVLLYKISAQRDIIIGLPAAGQAVTDNAGLVGHCVNLLPLKSSPDGRIPFSAYLKQRKSEILEAFEHQQITFGTLLKTLNIPRDPSRVTLVPVVFNVDLGLDNDVHFEELTYRLYSNPRHYETFELFVNISDYQSGLTVEWSYNTALFLPETIQQFHAQFKLILEQLTNNAETTLNELSLFDNTALKTLSAALNNTTKSYPKTMPLHELIRSTAGQYPEKTAISFGQQQLSYRELDRRSNQFAQALQAKGIQVGDKIGLAIPRTEHMLVALLGIMKVGAVFLPLDPNYPVARITYILADVSAQLLISSRTNQQVYETDAESLFLEDLIAELEQYPDAMVRAVNNPDALIYILHTSGSTGQPKGVEVKHQSVVNLFYWMLENPGIGPADRLLAITSISFDISYVELFLPLLAGAEIILADTETAKDGRLLLQLMEDERISLMQATPATWNMLINSGWQRKLPIRLICGGEALSIDLAKALLKRSNALWNIYGPTETTIYTIGKQISETDTVITIGQPVNNTQVYILDENLQQLPQGSIGEIYIAGDNLADGYINKPELTAERFLPNPFGAGNLYKTGDLGRLLPEAEIQCLGRSDHQIKIRGFRIEPEEIAHQLVEMPDLKAVFVDGIQAANDDIRLIAYVVIDDAQQNTFEENVSIWKKQLKAVLPEYMIPHQFIGLQELPLTPNGKIDKKKLELLAETSQPEKEDVFVEAHTKAQKLIAAIWKDLLALDKVSIHDNFFELGGHSLIAVSVMVRIENETGVRLPIATLFQNSTIEKLASFIETKDVEIKWSSLVPIKPSGAKTPVYIIHGSGLNVFMFHSMVNYLDPERPLYGIQAVGLDGSEQAIQSIEHIASIYISDMLAENPDGPYALLGYSLGGMIAIEMAKQLKAMGKTVTMLGMIDTYVDNVELFDSPGVKLLKKIWRQIPKLWFILKSFIKYPKDTILYQLNMVKNRFKKLFGHEEKMISSEQSFQERIYAKYEDVYGRYKLSPYDDVIHLFKVKKRLYFLDDPRYLGWRPFAPAGLKIHNLPGDHKTFIQPPFEKRFVDILDQVLNATDTHVKS
ncbi:non-ribosomal peptide synthetase [Pedobacter duraquae]|uniref:Amino acid adenylation domain-containing protein n=1 Tax=Pedobacter duraquae TaxID=425511 RepID=A0A4R6ID90_9SPHI|nr:non-ribosomal peptide synthetase [Pedobacter duraquae]TDO19557.1 amino acid adenylation domain-containing protein [Pedobacter duraquae]